jgi:hypothetical protein
VGGDLRDGVRHRRDPGFLALMLHTIGSLTKLFYEAVESAQDKPVRGLAACGASHLQRIRFALWPQVKPIFLSYGFMRLEINFRSSTILGLVGAGGIGQELMTNIKLDRYDQVSITLLLIIIVVSLLDMLSGRLRQWVLEGKMSQWQINRISPPAVASIGIYIRPRGAICATSACWRWPACSTTSGSLCSSASAASSSPPGCSKSAAICCGCSSGTTFSTGRFAITSRKSASPGDCLRRDADRDGHRAAALLSGGAQHYARRDSGNDRPADAPPV